MDIHCTDVKTNHYTVNWEYLVVGGHPLEHSFELVEFVD